MYFEKEEKWSCKQEVEEKESEINSNTEQAGYFYFQSLMLQNEVAS